MITDRRLGRCPRTARHGRSLCHLSTPGKGETATRPVGSFNHIWCSEPEGRFYQPAGNISCRPSSGTKRAAGQCQSGQLLLCIESRRPWKAGTTSGVTTQKMFDHEDLKWLASQATELN